MAATTIGGTLPDGSVAPIGDVLVWSGEDDAKDTILPRFVAADSACSRMHIGARSSESRAAGGT